MQWASFRYKDADRVGLILGEDSRGNDCQLVYQISKGGQEELGFRSMKDELILSREPHPAMWDKIPAEVRAEIEKVHADNQPSVWERFYAWLKDFKRVVSK